MEREAARAPAADHQRQRFGTYHRAFDPEGGRPCSAFRTLPFITRELVSKPSRSNSRIAPEIASILRSIACQGRKYDRDSRASLLHVCRKTSRRIERSSDSPLPCAVLITCVDLLTRPHQMRRKIRQLIDQN